MVLVVTGTVFAVDGVVHVGVSIVLIDGGCLLVVEGCGGNEKRTVTT